MNKIELSGLASLMENRTFSNLKLENIELICSHEKSTNYDYTYSIAFTNKETNELFVSSYTFGVRFQSELWYDSVYRNSDLNEISVEVFPAELIYIPKYKKL
ncbi:MAG: hypothetical protein ABIP51_20055 [Bacteroidia bacterium]